jgi:hypothetical protein
VVQVSRPAQSIQSIQSVRLSIQSFELGLPRPHPQNSVVPPPPLPFGPKGGETLACGGRGDPIPKMGQTVWYSRYTIIPLRRPNTSSCHRPLHVLPVATIRPLHVLPVATDRYMSCQLPHTAACLASCHIPLHALPVATDHCMSCNFHLPVLYLQKSATCLDLPHSELCQGVLVGQTLLPP